MTKRGIWIVTLASSYKGRYKKHVTRNNEAGYPRDTTLCGLACSDRRACAQTATLSGQECPKCLLQLTPKKPSRLLWHRSDKKVHWIRDDNSQLACGQECATYGAGWIEMVTCERCLDLAAEAGVKKHRKAN
jgi:hypothetical protein